MQPDPPRREAMCTKLAVASGLLALAFSAAPAQAQEQWIPPPPQDPAAQGPADYQTFDVDEAPPDEAAPSINVFYESLRPYGRWVQDARWGQVWAPSDRSYRPYERGYWQATKFGFTWIAAEPFGWIVGHYGRWFWNGQWLWRPDTVWGPAWVLWREANGYVGWAPMPPDNGMVYWPEHWCFVPARNVLRVDLARAYAAMNLRRVLLSGSRPVVRYARSPRGDLFVAGPDYGWLRSRYDVSVVPRPFLPRATGRFRGDAWHDQRLQEQHRRAEATERLRQVEEQRRWHQSDQRRWRQAEQRPRVRDHRDAPPAPRLHR
jgi:uncharacterized protein DUF6600